MTENKADEAAFDTLSLVALWEDDLYAVILADVVVVRRIERSTMWILDQDADHGARICGE